MNAMTGAACTWREAHRQYTGEVRSAVSGRWPQALTALGIDGRFLRNKHGPCPGCGGKDRFRFDDKGGRGTFVCGRGGNPLAGDGFALVMHAFACDFAEADRLVGDVFGIEPPEKKGARVRRNAQAPSEPRAALDASRRAQVVQDAKRRAIARARAASIWNTAGPSAQHAYLARKGIQPHGTRAHRDCLVVPLRDGSGQLQSLEFISADGAKRFLRHGQVAGCYFAIGTLGDALCIAEGFATAASVHEATGHASACAFFAGNLKPVAEILRAKFPSVRFILCADNDRDSPDNPGLAKARDAARAVGALLTAPTFRPGDDGTDWNDYAARYGMEALRAVTATAV